MFFRKEFFSVIFFQNKNFLGTLFRKFSFHEKICFWNFLILNYFFSKEIMQFCNIFILNPDFYLKSLELSLSSISIHRHFNLSHYLSHSVTNNEIFLLYFFNTYGGAFQKQMRRSSLKMFALRYTRQNIIRHRVIFFFQNIESEIPEISGLFTYCSSVEYPRH